VNVTPDWKPVKRQTCKRGHPWTDETTLVNVRGIRECRLCKRENNAAYKAKRRAAGIRDDRSSWPSRTSPGWKVCVECGKREWVKHTKSASERCQSCALTGERVAIGCTSCGGKFEVWPSQRSRRRYCSHSCRIAGILPRLRDRKGAKNPNYRHGEDAWRKGWSVAAKGEECCRNCGSTGTLHLHHAIPRSKYRRGRAELLNGIPLCPTCHSGWHSKKLAIYRSIFTEAEWAWFLSQELTGENIEAWLDRAYPKPACVVCNDLGCEFCKGVAA
jgi:hypothetical protein